MLRFRPSSYFPLKFLFNVFETDYPYQAHDAYDNMYVIVQEFASLAAAEAARNDKLFCQTPQTNDALFVAWVYTHSRECQGPHYHDRMKPPTLITSVADKLGIEQAVAGSRTTFNVVYDCWMTQRRVGQWAPSRDLEATTMYNKLLELLRLSSIQSEHSHSEAITVLQFYFIDTNRATHFPAVPEIAVFHQYSSGGSAGLGVGLSSSVGIRERQQGG